MIRLKDIQEAFLNVVAWAQEPTAPQIADNLTKSLSGLYFQGGHPMVNIDTIKSLSPAVDLNTYKEYDSTRAYKKGDVVRSKGQAHEAARDVPPDTPPEENPAYWTANYPLNKHLESLTRDAINTVINKVLTRKLTNRTLKTIHEHKFLFDGAARLADRVENIGHIVGLEVVPARRLGATLKIDKLGIQLTGPATFPIYLMHSAQREAILIKDIEYKGSGGMEWFDVDMVLPYWSAATDAGGSWFIVYSQKDLPEGVQAVRKDKDWSKAPCGTCNRAEIYAYRLMSEFAEIYPFRTLHKTGDFNDDFNDDFSIRKDFELWDIADNVYTPKTNYGLNLCVSVHCDLTDFLIMQKTDFAEALQLQMSEIVLRRLVFNPNRTVNRAAFNVDTRLLSYELDGDPSSYKKSGVSYRLEKAIEAIDVNLRGLNSLCLPCAKHRGIRMRTA